MTIYQEIDVEKILINPAAQSGNLSVNGIVSQAVAGGASNAILTAIIGAIKNRVAA
jgi:hypothetical protein